MRHKKVKLSFLFLMGITLSNLQAQTVQDIDGNVYQSVIIGTQTWTKENLKVTRYRNGDIIGTTTPDTLNLCSSNLPKYQWAWEGNESKVASYGRLYTWYAATDNRNVCPIGWHVPNDKEWSILTKFLRSENEDVNKFSKNDTIYWSKFYTLISSKNGFSALSSSHRGCGGFFLAKERGGYSWWSSSTGDNTLGKSSVWSLGSFGPPLKDYNEEIKGLPVRCLKD